MLPWGTFRSWLAEYLQARWGVLTWIAAVFAAGLLFGGLAVGALPSQDRFELAAFLGTLLEQVAFGGGPVVTGAVFQASLLHTLRLLLLLWVLGLSVLGAPLIFVLVFLRGFLLGFAVTFVIGQLGAKGVAVALGAVLPQGLLMAAALFLAGVGALTFAAERLKQWLGRAKGGFSEGLGQYTLAVATGGLLLLLASVTEAFIGTSLLQWLS